MTEHVIKHLSSVINPIAVIAILLICSLHCYSEKIFNQKTNFRNADSAILCEIFVDRLIFPRVMQENVRGFLEHSG